MSIQDITFSITDQRSTNGKLAIVMSNVPLQLSNREIVLILRRMQAWVLSNFLSQKQPTVEVLRDALSQGIIDQTAFDFLTG